MRKQCEFESALAFALQRTSVGSAIFREFLQDSINATVREQVVIVENQFPLLNSRKDRPDVSVLGFNSPRTARCASARAPARSMNNLIVRFLWQKRVIHGYLFRGAVTIEAALNTRKRAVLLTVVRHQRCVDGPAKVVSENVIQRRVKGKIPIGALDKEFEIKPAKAGKVKVTITVTGPVPGTEPKAEAYEFEAR